VKDNLVAAMAAMPPETTIAFFAFEDARAKAPPASRGGQAAGGDVSASSPSRSGSYHAGDRRAGRARAEADSQRPGVGCGRRDAPGTALPRAREVEHRVRSGATPTTTVFPTAWRAAPSARLGRSPTRSWPATATPPHASSCSCGHRATRVESLGLLEWPAACANLAVALQLEPGIPQATICGGANAPKGRPGLHHRCQAHRRSMRLRRALTSARGAELERTELPTEPTRSRCEPSSRSLRSSG